MWRDTVIAGTDVREEVFDSVLHLQHRDRQGGQGRPNRWGRRLYRGDSDAVLGKSKQLILKPFEGHRPRTGCSPTTIQSRRTSRNGAARRAFVVRGDGRIEAAARYHHHRHEQGGESRKGSGTRHIFGGGDHARHERNRHSSSRRGGGKISIFKDGRMVQEIA
jgi:hypothetical protein